MDKADLERACLEKAILDRLKAAHEDTRNTVAAQLDAGDRLNSSFGYALKTNPKTRWVVEDRDALIEWCEANAPDALAHSVSINPAFEKRLLSDGGFRAGDTVHPVDGLAETQGRPVMSIKITDAAIEAAETFVSGIRAVER